MNKLETRVRSASVGEEIRLNDGLWIFDGAATRRFVGKDFPVWKFHRDDRIKYMARS